MKPQLTIPDLELLSTIIHDYKDTHRGDKETLLPVMELEKKLVDISQGFYEPDTTYDWKGDTQ